MVATPDLLCCDSLSLRAWAPVFLFICRTYASFFNSTSFSFWTSPFIRPLKFLVTIEIFSASRTPRPLARQSFPRGIFSPFECECVQADGDVGSDAPVRFLASSAFVPFRGALPWSLLSSKAHNPLFKLFFFSFLLRAFTELPSYLSALLSFRPGATLHSGGIVWESPPPSPPFRTVSTL